MTFIKFLESILWVECAFVAGFYINLLRFLLTSSYKKDDRDGSFLLLVLVIEYLIFFIYFFISYFDKTNAILLIASVLFLIVGFISVSFLYKWKFKEVKTN